MSKIFNEHRKFEKMQDENMENKNDFEFPHNWWLEDLKEIKNTEILTNELENAKKIVEKEKNLDDKLESSEISKDRYDHEKLVVLGKEKAKFGTRCALESEGITYAEIQDVSKDHEILTSMKEKTSEMKKGVKELIRDRGPEYAKELADEMLEKRKISKPTHQTITTQTRLKK